MKRININQGIWASLVVMASLLLGCRADSDPSASIATAKPDTPQANLTSVEREIKFGAYTSDKASAVVSQFKPLTEELEARMSVDLGERTRVSMEVFSSYEAGVDAIAEGKVDLMRLGPASYITARQKDPHLQLLCAEAQDGEMHFSGIIASYESSDIESIADLEGRSFAFGNKMSTIGRYLVQSMMVEEGLTSKSLSRFEYLDRHDLVGSAVANKEYDAGALKESIFRKLKEKGLELREIARFDNVTKPWVASSKVDTVTASAITRALMAIEDPAVFEALGKNGFVRAERGDYDAISDAMAKALQSF